LVVAAVVVVVVAVAVAVVLSASWEVNSGKIEDML
jgi:hypothetical protein